MRTESTKIWKRTNIEESWEIELDDKALSGYVAVRFP